MIRRLLVLGFLLALFVPAEAVAAPPVLLSVGVVSSHATATWSLPPGVEAAEIEVATSPNAGSDGYFFAENRKAFNVLQETQTAWTDTYPIGPGTYYVHVLGLDRPCFFAGSCPVREASNVMVLTVGPPPPPPQTLSVFKSGSGAGTVTSDPAGIDCGATCSVAYPAGIHVMLTATPASGSVFAGWSNACTLSPRCEVTMNSTGAVTARFDTAPVMSAPPATTPVTPARPLTPPTTAKNQAPRVAIVRKVRIGSRVAVQLKICHNESGPLRAEIRRIGVGSMTREFFLEKSGCAWYQVKTNWKSVGPLAVRARDADGAWGSKKLLS